MTTNSDRFKYADPQDPWAIIPTPWGQMEAWRASAMATGTMGALAQVYKIVRNDAAELQEKTVAFDAKKASVLRTVNKLLNFMSRVDALTSRIEALEAKHRADEERQREFEEPIQEPPGTSDDPTAWQASRTLVDLVRDEASSGKAPALALSPLASFCARSHGVGGARGIAHPK